MDAPLQVKKYVTLPGEPLQFVEEVAMSYKERQCLIWPFGRSTNGYGILVLNGGKQVVASRYVCQRVHGAPPTMDHEAAFTCYNGQGGCVSPIHLTWQTREEINQIMNSSGRAAKGTDMPQAKLNEQKVRAIRRAAQSASMGELAEFYGVSRTTIHKVIHRKKWRWVDI